MISGRSVETMRQTSAGSPRRPEYPRSILPCTGRLPSRSCAPSCRAAADQLRQFHPLRLQYELFSDTNPLMTWVKALADQVEDDRKPVAAENPFVALEQTVSRQIEAGLDAWRDMTEAFAESTFLSVYGSPALQAAVGIDPADYASAKEGRKDPTPSASPAIPDRRTAVAYIFGRPSRMHGAQPCFMSARRAEALTSGDSPPFAACAR